MNILTIILSLFSLGISLREDFQNYSLIFKEYFNSTETLEANWDFEIGIGDIGRGNGEKQYYRTSTENIFIENNQLHIKTIKKNILNNIYTSYTSGRLTTKKTFNFAYGYVKTRMKLPKAKGVWTRFWMLGENMEDVGWPNCGEIDIIETINDNDILMNNLHWFDDGTQNRGDYGSENIVINRDEFHIYELLWEEDYIKIYIDGEQTYIIDIEHIATNAFTKQFYFILNLSVGGHFIGDDIDDSKFPLEFIVDYIEVYQKNNNYKYKPKYLVYEMAPELKSIRFKENDHFFLKDGMLHLKDFSYGFIASAYCFKYGELKMKVSLTDERGVLSQIYLYNREIYYEKKGKEKNELVRNKNNNGEIAVIIADGSHKIKSGAKWGEENIIRNQKHLILKNLMNIY